MFYTKEILKDDDLNDLSLEVAFEVGLGSSIAGSGISRDILLLAKEFFDGRSGWALPLICRLGEMNYFW